MCIRDRQEESRRYTEVIPQIFTNRRKGQVISMTKGEEMCIRDRTRTRNGKYYVEKTKTENGVRFIYMTDEVKAVSYTHL